MSSQFSIVEADLVPDLVAYDDFQDLMRRSSDSSVDATFDDIAVAAENELLSYIGGMYTEAANIALAKPQVMFVMIYRLHTRRAQNPDYKPPQQVIDDYKAAIDWAKSIGARLLAAEGDVDPPGSMEVEYTAPTAEHTMTKLDYL